MEKAGLISSSQSPSFAVLFQVTSHNLLSPPSTFSLAEDGISGKGFGHLVSYSVCLWLICPQKKDAQRKSYELRFI